MNVKLPRDVGSQLFRLAFTLFLAVHGVLAPFSLEIGEGNTSVNKLLVIELSMYSSFSAIA